METFDVVACVECRTYWSEDSAQAACVRSDHTHRRARLHRHRDRVELPDGLSVLAASFDDDHPYVRERSPDYGLYLDRRWQPPWPHDHLDWPDFEAPSDPASIQSALRVLLEKARKGQIVEIGCQGGHGRTGTALACLVVLLGAPANDAIDWVRNAYCTEAVETPQQASFVTQFNA